MANMNRVFLIGNLTRDPELRYIPNGTAVCNFGMAINQKYKTQSGDMKEDVTYVNITAWGKTAENCGEYLSKGSPVIVEGRLKFSSWEDPDGKKRSKLEVTAQWIQFLWKKGDSGPPAERAAGPEGKKEDAPQPATGDEVPF